MMSSPNNNHSHRQAILTQDSPPSSPTSTGTEKPISFNEAVDLFINPGDLSPASTAKIMAPIIREQAKRANFESTSPERQRLFLRQEAISHKMPYLSPSTKRRLETLTAAGYIKRRQCFNSTNICAMDMQEPQTREAKRAINFTVDNKELEVEPDTKSIDNNVQVVKPPEKPIVEPDLITKNDDNDDSKSKLPRQNIIWKRVPHTDHVDYQTAKDELTKNHPSLKTRGWGGDKLNKKKK